MSMRPGGAEGYPGGGSIQSGSNRLNRSVQVTDNYEKMTRLIRPHV